MLTVAAEAVVAAAAVVVGVAVVVAVVAAVAAVVSAVVAAVAAVVAAVAAVAAAVAVAAVKVAATVADSDSDTVMTASRGYTHTNTSLDFALGHRPERQPDDANAAVLRFTSCS